MSDLIDKFAAALGVNVEDAKHTPGPWVYERDPDGDRCIIDTEGDALFCDTPYYPWCSDNEADWPLIAAAPELLARLKSRRAWCTCDSPNPRRAGTAVCDECKADAAAIAKAEGK